MTAVLFLFIVVLVSTVGGVVLWLQHRQPTTLESGLDAFKREMEALAPSTDEPPVRRTKRPTRPRPASPPDETT